MCAWVEGEFKYAKYERCVSIKHGKAPTIWFYKKLEEWGIEESKVDGFAFVDTSHTFAQKRIAPPPFYDEDFLRKSQIRYPYITTENPNILTGFGWNGAFSHLGDDHYFMLDHHFAHIMSHREATFNSHAIASDSGGSNDTITVIRNPRFHDVIRYRHDEGDITSCSTGKVLQELGEKMGLNVTGLESDVDLCGKIMGLQSFGEVNDAFVETWTSRGQQYLQQLTLFIRNCPIDPKPDNSEWLELVASVFKVCGNVQKELFKVFDKESVIQYTGGVAQNVCWNRELLNDGYTLSIEPHVTDEGLSIGCLRFLGTQLGVNIEMPNFPYVQDDEAPESRPSDKTMESVAEMLADGKIVGWYQGHGEIGSRALGNRSILMDPSIKGGKDVINAKVKHREWWRPFGASVKEDKSAEYFDVSGSPYMMYTANVLQDGLYPITHVDGTCRPQTLTEDQNEDFYNLIDRFESRTGLPLLLNTSLNLGGKPIAGTIAEAKELFDKSEMDALCIGDEIITK